MTLTLVADVNSTDTFWRMTDAGNLLPTLALPCLATIGSEDVEITGINDKPTSSDVVRGVVVTRRRNNTTAASHSAGATLVPTTLGSGGGGGGGVSVEVPPAAPVVVTNLVIPGATVAGGTATILSTQLIGPYTVAFDDIESHSAWKPLSDELTVGTLVVKAWAIYDEYWYDDVAGGNQTGIFKHWIGVTDQPVNHAIPMVAYDPYQPDSGSGNPANAEYFSETLLAAPTTGPISRSAVIDGTGMFFGVKQFFTTSDPATQGSMRVYAIVAVPAS